MWSAEDVVAAVLKKLYKDEFNKSNYRDISSFGWARQGMANGEVRIFIARWREASISTDSELKDFITSQSGIDSSKATQIKVLDKFSYMNLPEKEATLIMQYFKKENGARPVEETLDDDTEETQVEVQAQVEVIKEIDNFKKQYSRSIAFFV